MNRQWRIGRIILAVMLMGLAGLAFYVWPGVSWKVAGEKAIGFDVAKGLLYAIKSDEGKHQLRAYDLGSGEKRFTVELEPHSAATQQESMKDIAKSWKWQLSPNKRELIAISHSQTNIQLVDLATGKLLRKLTFDEPARFFSLSEISIGFSRNGELFAVQDEIMHGILIWNLTNGERIEVANRDEPEGISYVSIITRDYYRPVIDLIDGKMAYYRGTKSFIYDFVNRKQVLEHDARSRPRFLDNGQLLIFTPVRIDKEHKPACYQRESNGTWKAVTIELACETSERHFVSYTDDFLVTDCPLTKQIDRPEWLPTWSWRWANRLFGFRGARHRLQYWNLHTGQLAREFSFFESTAGFGFNASYLESRAFVSEDGQWLTVEYDGEMMVWDVRGRRTVWCWVVIFVLVVFATRCAWPRKVKLT